MKKALGLVLMSLAMSWVMTSAKANSVYDPSLRKPVELKQPDESKTLNKFVIPHEGDTTIPELFFKDQSGKIVKFSDYFDGKTPVVLNVIYLSCPRLCSEVLNGVTESLQSLKMAPGKDYKVLTVSFDPREGNKWKMAASKRQTYIENFHLQDKHGPREFPSDAWTMLVGQSPKETGDHTHAKTLCEMLDYQFTLNEDGQYEHGSMTIFLSPKGKITRYLYGTKYESKNMNHAILEAGEGKVGSPIQTVISWCYRYDPKSNGYTPAVMRIMTIAGAVSALLFGSIMFKMWRKEVRNGSIK